MKDQRKKEWLGKLSSVDKKYVAEADPTKHRKKGKIFVGTVAACLSLLIIASTLVLFIPFRTTPPDTQQFGGSEYFRLTDKLSLFTFKKPQYKNNYEVLKAVVSRAVNSISLKKYENGGMLFDGTDGVMPVPEEVRSGDVKYAADGTNEAVTYSTASESDSEYKEVTDNQVAGVLEADRIKRSDKYIYYMYDRSLEIFSIKKGDSKKVGEFKLTFDAEYVTNQEFFLSKDCKTVTVIARYYNKKSGSCVGVTSLDVSNPEKIKEIKTVCITGGYISSRFVGDTLLLVTDFQPNVSKIDFNDESTFLPQIDTGKGMKSVPSKDIVVPDDIIMLRYTVVSKLDGKSLDEKGTKAFFSFTDDFYATAEKLYLFRVFSDITEKNGGKFHNTMTEITCLDYSGNELTEEGKVTVRGYVKDQYSLDEFDGILRVVTTTNETNVGNYYYSSEDYFSSPNVIMTATGASSASLYCVDIKTWKVVAEVVDFAPKHEEVRSVRFDGKMAYVCTAIEISDPVFFFDLSDINNITYKDTGNINGFSSSLINFGNGCLLGIGSEGWSDLKVEVYRETSDGVESVAKYIRDNTRYSDNYKSYYVDRDAQAVGIGVTDGYENFYKYNTSTGNKESSVSSGYYILLHFDGYNINEIVCNPLAGDNEFKRGVLIDGWLYMFGNSDFAVKQAFGN